MTVNQICRLIAHDVQRIPGIMPSVAPTLAPGLFVPAASRSYNGADYDFSQDGLYSILSVGPYNGGFCISYTSDVLELMRSLAFLTQYGRADEGLTASQAQNQMRMRKVAMRCGPVNDIVVKPICAALGVPHRAVRWLTAETPNGFDDGHVACEVRISGAWKYFDIPTKAYFEGCGEIQSASDIAEAGVANLNTIELCPGDSYPETCSNAWLHTSAYYMQTLATPAARADWRCRICQIPGIDAPDGLTYFYMPVGTETRSAWVLSLSSTYRVLSEADWLAKFYP